MRSRVGGMALANETTMQTVGFSLDELPNDLREAGAEMAVEINRLLATADPNINALAMMCKGCTFRRETEANVYPGTLLSVVLCAVEGEVFECHDRANEGHPIPNGKPCWGFLAYFAELATEEAHDL